MTPVERDLVAGGPDRQAHRGYAEHRCGGSEQEDARPSGHVPAERERPDDGGREQDREPEVQSELAGDARDGRRRGRRDRDGRRDDRARRHVDAEAERAGRLVAVRLGHHAPGDRVHPVGKILRHRDLQLVLAAGPPVRGSRFHGVTVDVQHVDDRELLVGRFRERQRDLAGSVVELRARRWVGARQVRVR